MGQKYLVTLFGLLVSHRTWHSVTKPQNLLWHHNQAMFTSLISLQFGLSLNFDEGFWSRTFRPNQTCWIKMFTWNIGWRLLDPFKLSSPSRGGLSKPTPGLDPTSYRLELISHHKMFGCSKQPAYQAAIQIMVILMAVILLMIWVTESRFRKQQPSLGLPENSSYHPATLKGPRLKATSRSSNRKQAQGRLDDQRSLQA